MGEEEKQILVERGFKFDYMTQLKIMWNNRLFMLTSLASVFLMISNDQVHRILEIVHV
jgi:hypothetical protein